MTSSCISLLASFTNGVTSAKNGHFFTASIANGNKHKKNDVTTHWKRNS
jgi:hypothetical protein